MKFLKELCSSCGIVDSVVSRLQLRDQAALIRATSRSGSRSSLLLDIPKLEHANLAGGSRARKKRGKGSNEPEKDAVCSLILTEGDSAKVNSNAHHHSIFCVFTSCWHVRDVLCFILPQALAVAGLSVVGRDLYGVYPLRGKPLNARDAPVKQISANKELQDLVAALGLDFTKSYETV